MQRPKTVARYIAAKKEWEAELVELRSILRSTGLEEGVKWGAPVYMLDGKNVVGIGAFKAYCGLWFFQGALLKDKNRQLVNAQEGKTKSMRQMRFGSVDDIHAPTVRAYAKEATGLARKGVEVKPERGKPVTLPAELQAALRRRRKAKTSFDGMTLGKRREYAEYVASAKRDDTRQRRIEKILPMIESGIGLNDKYR